MTAVFDSPNHGDLTQAAREALLIEAYRQGKLTHFELSQAMGLDRFETDDLLKRHHVTEDLMTVEEFKEELRSLGRDPRP